MRNLQQYRHRHGRLPLFLILVWLALFGPTALFKYIWLDLRSVSVDEQMLVHADRVIRQDFEGSFKVVLRNWGTGEIVCKAGSKRSFPYVASASRVNPIDMPFWQWMGMDATYERLGCLSYGLSHSVPYYIVTCHYAHAPYGFKYGRRCVSSKKFTITEVAFSELFQEARL